jgi:hypothetical protein
MSLSLGRLKDFAAAAAGHSVEESKRVIQVCRVCLKWVRVYGCSAELAGAPLNWAKDIGFPSRPVAASMLSKLGQIHCTLNGGTSLAQALSKLGQNRQLTETAP